MSEQEEYSQTLYERDSKGRTKVWKIRVGDPQLDESPAAACIYVNSGLIDGKLAENLTIIRQGKNKGKANETSPWAQAVLEAKAKTKKMHDKGYVDDVANLREVGVMGSGTREPMLAQKFHPQHKLPNSKDLDQLKLRGEDVGIQRKKDGNRANPTINEDGKLYGYMSRKGTPYPYHFPQITKVLEEMYQRHPELKGKKVELDGELFTTQLTFDELNGILKKKSVKEEHIPLLETVEFHIYDIFSDEHYKRRIELFTPFGEPLDDIMTQPLTEEQAELIADGVPEEKVRDTRRVKVIETIFVKAEDDVLQEYLTKFLDEGEEGLMIRTLNQPYIHKRTWNLMKYKVTQTEDYVIKRFELDKRGILGKIYMVATPGMRDRKGNPIDEFKVGTKQNRETLRKMWAEQDEYIGQVAVVEFGNFTQYGVPRFGKFKGRRADYTEDVEDSIDASESDDSIPVALVPHRTIIEIKSFLKEDTQEVAVAIVPGWDASQDVRIPFTIIPAEMVPQIMDSLNNNESFYVFAEVTIGARQASELTFSNFEIARRPHDSLLDYLG